MGCSSSQSAEVTPVLPRTMTVKYSFEDVQTAIAKGDASKIRTMLLADATAAIGCDPRGNSALHLAAEHDQGGQAHCLEALLERPGLDLNGANSDGWTPLHTAARHGKVPALRLLLRSNAKPNLPDLASRRPLHLAAEHGHVQCLEAALPLGADPGLADIQGQTPLHLVAARGDEACLRPLLAARPPAPVDAADSLGRTALHLAAEGGHETIVRALLDRGANKELKNSAGATPGRVAAMAKHPRCAAMLGGVPLEEDFSSRITLEGDLAPPAPAEPVLHTEDAAMLGRVQALLDAAAAGTVATGRRLEAVQVLRSTNAALWRRYCDQREELALHYAAPLAAVRTATEAWDASLAEPRKGGVNEFFLLLGCSPAAARGVCEAGNWPEPAMAGVCGPGLRFAESGAAADEQAGDDADGLYKGLYAMLLCRVALGNPLVVSDAQPDLEHINTELETETHASVVGEHGATARGSRDFVLRNPAQAYPSYVVVYRRTVAVPAGN